MAVTAAGMVLAVRDCGKSFGLSGAARRSGTVRFLRQLPARRRVPSRRTARRGRV